GIRVWLVTGVQTCALPICIRAAARAGGVRWKLRSSLETLDRRLVSCYLPIINMVALQMNPWDALGDPTRRAIFERLVARPRAVEIGRRRVGKEGRCGGLRD